MWRSICDSAKIADFEKLLEDFAPRDVEILVAAPKISFHAIHQPIPRVSVPEGVAQLVEQQTFNLRVMGSIPIAFISSDVGHHRHISVN